MVRLSFRCSLRCRCASLHRRKIERTDRCRFACLERQEGSAHARNARARVQVCRIRVHNRAPAASRHLKHCPLVLQLTYGKFLVTGLALRSMWTPVLYTNTFSIIPALLIAGAHKGVCVGWGMGWDQGSGVSELGVAMWEREWHSTPLLALFTKDFRSERKAMYDI